MRLTASLIGRSREETLDRNINDILGREMSRQPEDFKDILVDYLHQLADFAHHVASEVRSHEMNVVECQSALNTVNQAHYGVGNLHIYLKKRDAEQKQQEEAEDEGPMGGL